jgi:hypothetical protein
LPTPLPAPVTTAIFCAAIGVSLFSRHSRRRQWVQSKVADR